MKAFVLDDFDNAPTVRDDLPEPSVSNDELLVRVHASSVNPVDVHIAAGALKAMAEYEFPVIIGRDVAGVVEQIGSGVDSYQVGDEVFGFLPMANPAVHDGSWAELIVVPADNFVAKRAQSIDFAAAGAAPLAGITALAAADAIKLAKGETVLVIGATGGVGSFFVQLAAAAGATVIASGLPEDEEYLRGLGVTELVDRGAEPTAVVREAHPDGIDAIVDLVNFTPDASTLKDGGRLASPLGAGEGAGRFNIMAQPTLENLQRLAELLDDSVLRVPIQQTFRLDQAAEAMQTLQTRHTQGKLGLEIR
jgi:NADPH:quinone reductase-like Zn-dependent oxidoreductase